MCDSPRGRVDWGLSDCFLKKRQSYSCDTYIFTCVATFNIYLHSVIILLPDLLTNSPRLGIRLWIQRCSCSPSRPPVAKFASEKFQNHIFASVGFLTSFIKSSSMAVKTKAAWYIFSSDFWPSGCAAVMSMHPVFLCLQIHVSATIIGSLPSKSQQLSVICENAFWLQSAFNSFQPHHIPLEFLIFCLLFWSNSSVRAIAAKRQLAITWNPWKCQIDGSDSGWWTSVLWMHMNATKFCDRNTNTVEIQ